MIRKVKHSHESCYTLFNDYYKPPFLKNFSTFSCNPHLTKPYRKYKAEISHLKASILLELMKRNLSKDSGEKKVVLFLDQKRFYYLFIKLMVFTPHFYDISLLTIDNTARSKIPIFCSFII